MLIVTNDIFSAPPYGNDTCRDNNYQGIRPFNYRLPLEDNPDPDPEIHEMWLQIDMFAAVGNTHLTLTSILDENLLVMLGLSSFLLHADTLEMQTYQV